MSLVFFSFCGATPDLFTLSLVLATSYPYVIFSKYAKHLRNAKTIVAVSQALIRGYIAVRKHFIANMFFICFTAIPFSQSSP